MASPVPVGALQDQQLAFQNNDGKNAFYQQIGAAKASGASNEQVANQYANNPWGISFQELLGAPASQPVATGYSAPAKDPYAAFGGRAGLEASKQSIFDNANTGIADTANQYGQGVTSLLHSLTTNQDALNRQGAQNELAKIQGTQGVLGMVNRGIKSGNTILANKNASNSSAAGAIANAYGDLGQRQLSQVGNQYGLANQDLGVKQAEQDWQLQNNVANTRANKDVVVNKMVNQARDSISALNAQMASASVPDRINIEQEVNRIKNDLVGRLQQFDSQLASASSNIRADSPEARMTAAQGMASQGRVAENPFQFSTQAPAQFQNTGSTANLPLYTFNRNKQLG